MKMRRFGRTGLEVSVLGFGAAPAAFLHTERTRAAGVVNELLDAGVNLIDTAASYPGSEEFLGEFFSHRRKDFVLVSKCPEWGEQNWTDEKITASIDRSLQRLRTDRIDVMLLHSCDLKKLEQGEAIGALAKAREAGKIRFAGYSGDNEAAGFAAAHPELAVLETSVNIVDQINLDMVLPVAKQHDVGVIIKRPLANAAWNDLATREGIYKSYAKTYTERLAKLGLAPVDLGFPGPADRAWAEIALRFVLSFSEAHTAIAGTTNPDHARINLEDAHKGPLACDAVEKIRAAFRRADPDRNWSGQQ
jgi:aryl-alcohol dehydrogenase-like predicted oxidoreductase